MSAAAVEVVTIGDELLLGATIDGNAAWIGRTLADAGIRVVRRATVGDDEAAIRQAVDEALARTGTVLCTGGLGPTRDDLTKPVVARLFGRPLGLDEALLEHIRRRFTDRGLEMPALNRGQAEVPEGATVFPNERGTAPGLLLEDEHGRAAVLLPGVPSEMRGLVESHVLPWLLRRAGARTRPIRSRVVRTTGIPESALAERVEPVLDTLAPLRVAFLPAPTGVDLRITSWGDFETDAVDERLEAAAAALTAPIAEHVYGAGGTDLVEALAAEIRARGWKLALAESCTGGLIARRITDPAGASDYFLGGVVSYANRAKETLLDVPAATLAEHGAVSEETARAMADGAARAFGAECAIAVTGVAGPTGGTPEKPVGTVWIAARLPDRLEARRYRFHGDRAEVRERAGQAALALLRSLLRGGVG